MDTEEHIKVQLIGAYILQEYTFIQSTYNWTDTDGEAHRQSLQRLQTQAKLQATAMSLALPVSTVLMSLIAQAAAQAPCDFPLPNSLCVHSRGFGTFSCGADVLKAAESKPKA